MPIVDANYRFIAAYQEVNARIVQRQQALQLYVTLVVSLLAAMVALRSGQADNLPVEWLLLGFPMASLCLTFLNYKGEQAISNLRHFLAALEQLEEAHRRLPSYNTDPQWSRQANQARRYHDLTSAVLVISAHAIALGAWYPTHPQTGLSWVAILTATVGLGCCIALLKLRRLSYRPSSANTDFLNNKESFY